MEAKATKNWLDDLKREFPAIWRETPHKGFCFGLLACWLILFQFWGNPTFGYVNTSSLLTYLYELYNAPASEDGHGNLIPFVVLALLWHKRDVWGPSRKDLWPAAMGGVALALGLHLVGYISQQPRISVVGLFAGIYFLTGLAWGKAWLRHTWFPFVLLAFCVPIGSMAGSITLPLRLISTKITVLVCHVFLGINVIQDGVTLIGPKGGYTYEVAAACSGIRSLVALLALTTIYGFVTFRTFWKQALCVVIAAPLAVTGNVARLTGIIVGREAFGEKAANFVHEWFGFVTFGLAIVCVMLLGHWLREDHAPASAPASQPAKEEEIS